MPLLLSGKTLTKNELTNLGSRAFRQKAQQLCPKALDYTLKNCDYLSSDESIDLAVLHFSQGFLIMAAEDAVLPVLAYSFDNDIDIDDLPPALNRLLSQYRDEIAAVRKLGIIPDERVRSAWDELRHSTRATTTETGVSPLLTSIWNQNKYYNFYCPEDENAPGGYDGKVPNGCVAVAMSQIMFYYRYPETGYGYHTNHSAYGSFHVNFAQQTYNYDAMCDDLGFYNSEVAKLIFHSGTAVDMGYGADGSGAYSQSVPDAMSTFFKYNTGAQFRYKDSFSDSTWHLMLKEELDSRRPVYYSGYSSEGGHAFVCDGYNSDDLFHFNFGWGGSGNGFYATSSSIDNAVNGYSGWQGAIFNLYPRTSNYPIYCNEKTITAINGTLEDGSGNFNYLNNTNCTYIITHPDQYSVHVTLKRFDTEENHDFLRFWDGHPSNGNLLAGFSGVAPSSDLVFETDSLYITFETDDSITANGWHLSFQTYREGIGCGTHLTTESSGIITDNSGDKNYRDNANCSWTLRINNANSITFVFDELDISPEDHLDFYDMSSYPYTLIQSISGNSIPAPMTFASNRIRVRFISDNYLNAQGFSMQWYGSSTGTDDFATYTNIFPNPADNAIHVSLGEAVDHCTLSLYNMVGQSVFLKTFESVGEMEIPTAQLPNGIYMLSIESQGRAAHRKIMIKH